MAPPDRRLFSARGWNLPIPEALFVIGGLIAQRIYQGPLTSNHIDGENAVLTGCIALVVGVPLLFIRLRVAWFDISYIVIGLAMYLYMLRFAGQPIILLGLVTFLGLGMMLAGASCLVRRNGAALLVPRRAEDPTVPG